MKRICLSPFFLALMLGLVLNVQASQKIPYRGTTVLVLLDSTEHDLPDGRTIYRTKEAGFLVADDHNHPLYLVPKTCYGSIVKTIAVSTGLDQIEGTGLGQLLKAEPGGNGLLSRIRGAKAGKSSILRLIDNPCWLTL